MKKYFVTLAHYNAWANARLYTVCANLSQADLKADRQAFFGSIHGTLNHLLVCDRTWMGRLTGKDAGIPTLDTILCENFAELRAAREAEDKRIREFVRALPEDSLNGILVYRSMDGTPCETPTHLVLAHMFNHATHHRGQTHGLLSQVPADPPPLDLLYFLREQSG